MPKKKASQTVFGEKLSLLRQKCNMSQIELADTIGTTQRAISSYETGVSYPPIPVVVQLAQALKASADELLGLRKINGQKIDETPEVKRLWRLFKKVMSLPEKDQRAIIRMVNSLATR